MNCLKLLKFFRLAAVVVFGIWVPTLTSSFDDTYWLIIFYAMLLISVIPAAPLMFYTNLLANDPYDPWVP